MTGYSTTNHVILNAFVERWHSETSSFYIPLGEMFITLDDVSCLLHLLIRGRLLDHGRITKDEELEMMVDHLRDNSEEAKDELDRTRGAHAMFEYLMKIYETEILRAEQPASDYEQVGLHIAHAIRAYLLYLVGTSIFMDKSSSYTDVVYILYFLDFERIHEYN